MDFVSIVVCPQLVDMPIGDGDFANFFTGEISREPVLPEEMFAFDFAFGLGRWGVTQADVIELEGPAQLGEGIGILGEEKTVVINVQLQGAAMLHKRGREKVEIGQEEFPFIQFGAGEQAAAIVEHVEHGEEAIEGGKPAVRGGVQLPQSPNLGALPAADGSQNPFGRDGMRQLIFDGPAPHLGPVEFEVVQPEGFGSGKAIRTGRHTGQSFAQQIHHRLGPGRGMVATGSAG